MDITITPEHLRTARQLTIAETGAFRYGGGFNEVCLVAVAAREVDPTVTSVAFKSIRRGDRPVLFIHADDHTVVERIITAFDAHRDDDVATMLPLTFRVSERIQQ